MPVKAETCRTGKAIVKGIVRRRGVREAALYNVNG